MKERLAPGRGRGQDDPVGVQILDDGEVERERPLADRAWRRSAGKAMLCGCLFVVRRKIFWDFGIAHTVKCFNLSYLLGKIWYF